MQDNYKVSLWHSSQRTACSFEALKAGVFKVCWFLTPFPLCAVMSRWQGMWIVCVLSVPEIGEDFVTLYFTVDIQPALSSLCKISLFLLTLLCPCLNMYLASGRPHICVFNGVIKLYMNKVGVARGRLRHGHLLYPCKFSGTCNYLSMSSLSVWILCL